MAQHAGADAAAGQRHRRHPAGGLQVDQPGDQPGRGRGRQQVGSAVNHHLRLFTRCSPIRRRASDAARGPMRECRPARRPDAGAAPFGLASGEAASLATVPGAAALAARERRAGGVPFVPDPGVGCSVRPVALAAAFAPAGAPPWSGLLAWCRRCPPCGPPLRPWALLPRVSPPAPNPSRAPRRRRRRRPTGAAPRPGNRAAHGGGARHAAAVGCRPAVPR